MTTLLKRRLGALEAELEGIYTMSEQAACECYGVNTKEEAIELIKDEIKEVEGKLEEEERTPPGWGMVDPAFMSLTDYYRMRY